MTAFSGSLPTPASITGQASRCSIFSAVASPAKTGACISVGTLPTTAPIRPLPIYHQKRERNPSRKSWDDDGYLETEQGRLPSHKFRRLHLNLPGSPEGSAYSAEKVMDSIDPNVSVRPPQTGISYLGFVDMSG